MTRFLYLSLIECPHFKFNFFQGLSFIKLSNHRDLEVYHIQTMSVHYIVSCEQAVSPILSY